jgi:hypothetical protein
MSTFVTFIAHLIGSVYIRISVPLLFQLCSGHVGLNLHLFCIHQSESPSCLHCLGITMESVKHVLLDCPQYPKEWHKLRCKLNATSLLFLLSSLVAVLPLQKYVHATGRFKSFFGKIDEDRIQTNAHRNVEIHKAVVQFEALIARNINCNGQ